MRTPGERIRETLERYKENEISRAEALADILRVFRSTCDNCKIREELKGIKLQKDRASLLKDIESEF